jgi:hypothetical protein
MFARIAHHVPGHIAFQGRTALNEADMPPVGGRHPARVIVRVAGKVDGLETAVYLLEIVWFSIQLVPLLAGNLAGLTTDTN